MLRLCRGVCLVAISDVKVALKTEAQGQAKMTLPGCEEAKIQGVRKPLEKVVLELPVVLVGGVHGAVNIPRVPPHLGKNKDSSEDVVIVVEGFDGRPDKKPVQEKSHRTVLVSIAVDMTQAWKDPGKDARRRGILVGQGLSVQALLRKILGRGIERDTPGLR